MLKLTESEVVKMVENDEVIERFNREVFKGQESCNGVIERDGKFYQIEFAQGLDEWGDIFSWDQNALEIEKVDETKSTWRVIEEHKEMI